MTTPENTREPRFCLSRIQGALGVLAKMNAVLQQPRPRSDLKSFHLLVLAGGNRYAGAGYHDNMSAGNVLFKIIDEVLLAHGWVPFNRVQQTA